MKHPLLQPLLLLAVSPALAFAQAAAGAAASPPPAAAPPDSPRTADLCSIEGRVVDGVTGEPVRKVLVRLRPADGTTETGIGGFSSSTDNSGLFSLRSIEPGRYQLSAEHGRFLRAEYGARRPGRAGTILSLDPGQRLQDLIVKLTPQAVVAGRVLDEEGEPMSDAQVDTVRYTYRDGQKRLVSGSRTTQTNDLGEYRLHGLEPGRWYLRAQPRGGGSEFADRSANADAPATYIPSYYPGTADLSSAAPVDLAPGAELRGIDFTLHKVRLFAVRGRLVNASGVAGHGITVRVQPVDQDVWAGDDVARTTPDGRFEIAGLTPGRYRLVASLFESSQRYAVGSQTIDLSDSNMNGVTITIPPPVELKGELRVEGDKPLGAASSSVLEAPRSVPVVSGQQQQRHADEG